MRPLTVPSSLLPLHSRSLAGSLCHGPDLVADAAGPLPAGDTATCARCGAIDPAARTVDVAIANARDVSIVAGDVSFTVTESPVVKRYHVTVHY